MNRPFFFLRRGNFPETIKFPQFRVLLKFMLMQRGIRNGQDAKIRTLFNQLCAEYGTDTLSRAKLSVLRDARTCPDKCDWCTLGLCWFK